jgi:hypothetical protein
MERRVITRLIVPTHMDKLMGRLLLADNRGDHVTMPEEARCSDHKNEAPCASRARGLRLQRELFADGARAVASPPRSKPRRPTEADLQAKLDAARARLYEIVVFGMKAWLPPATLHRLRDAEQLRRREVKMHYRMLERLREEQAPTRSRAIGCRRGEPANNLPSALAPRGAIS